MKTIVLKTDYQKSNEVTEVSLKRLSKKYASLLLSDNNRCLCASILLSYLCEKFDIPQIKKLVILDKPRKKSCKGELYGYYIVGKQEIYIYNITAKTRKKIAVKTFYDTLLHEFMHHYDHTKLKLTESKHTKGFYMRINDLKTKLGND